MDLLRAPSSRSRPRRGRGGVRVDPGHLGAGREDLEVVAAVALRAAPRRSGFGPSCGCRRRGRGSGRRHRDGPSWWRGRRPRWSARGRGARPRADRGRRAAASMASRCSASSGARSRSTAPRSRHSRARRPASSGARPSRRSESDEAQPSEVDLVVLAVAVRRSRRCRQDAFLLVPADRGGSDAGPRCELGDLHARSVDLRVTRRSRGASGAGLDDREAARRRRRHRRRADRAGELAEAGDRLRDGASTRPRCRGARPRSSPPRAGP